MLNQVISGGTSGRNAKGEKPIKKIAIVGSASMDLLVSTPRRPNPGETIIGSSLLLSPGGKGANQAVAAARLGAEVYMLGCVGDDPYGHQIIENLQQNNVHTEYIQILPNTLSGTAHITLEPDGTNSIIVIQGANLHVTPTYIEEHKTLLQEMDMVLLQQEIPPETIEAACKICNYFEIPVMLNPAPARSLSSTIIDYVSYLVPNEQECQFLAGSESVWEFLSNYPKKVFMTGGSQGVYYWDGIEKRQFSSHKVDVLDTTGAGDTFCAAFAVALVEKKGIEESVRFANRAAALSVTQVGAQKGMPTKEEVEALLEKS